MGVARRARRERLGGGHDVWRPRDGRTQKGVAPRRCRQAFHRSRSGRSKGARGARATRQPLQSGWGRKVSLRCGEVGEKAGGKGVAAAHRVDDRDGKARRPRAPRVTAMRRRRGRHKRARPSSISATPAMMVSSSSLTLRTSASSAASRATARISFWPRHNDGRRLTSTETSTPASRAVRTAWRCAPREIGSPSKRLPTCRTREQRMMSVATSAAPNVDSAQPLR